jgi:hypothetical protein
VKDRTKEALLLASPTIIAAIETLAKAFLYCALGVFALAIARVLPAILNSALH